MFLCNFRSTFMQLKGKLIFWIVFWPSFLLAVLLNEIRVRYDIRDDRPLIISFGIYVPLCSLGIVLAVKKLR